MLRRVAFLLLMCCVEGGFCQTVPPAVKAQGGYKLVFQDEFDSFDLSPDGLGRHNWYEGVWFNSKHAPLANISAASSLLSLSWHRGQRSADTSITTLSHDNQHFHAWRYGYFEIRMKWDVVAGAWPAVWMIPVQDATRQDVYAGQRESGEIDIFEGQGSQPNIIFATVHDWVNNKDSASRNNVVKLRSDVDLSQFHDYGLLWSPSKLCWYLDGKQIHSEDAPAILDKQDFYLVIGMQEGADWKAGNLDGVSATSMTTTVDWVRVWQRVR